MFRFLDIQFYCCFYHQQTIFSVYVSIFFNRVSISSQVWLHVKHTYKSFYHLLITYSFIQTRKKNRRVFYRYEKSTPSPISYEKCLNAFFFILYSIKYHHIQEYWNTKRHRKYIYDIIISKATHGYRKKRNDRIKNPKESLPSSTKSQGDERWSKRTSR